MTKYQAGRIDQLRRFADNYDLLVTFSDKKTNTGDFTIFIYEQGKSTYTVGFDGYWSEYNELSFERCIYQAFKWINKHVQNTLVKEVLALNSETLVSSIEAVLRDFGMEKDVNDCASCIYNEIKEILG